MKCLFRLFKKIASMSNYKDELKFIFCINYYYLHIGCFFCCYLCPQTNIIVKSILEWKHVHSVDDCGRNHDQIGFAMVYKKYKQELPSPIIWSFQSWLFWRQKLEINIRGILHEANWRNHSNKYGIKILRIVMKH